MLFIKSGMANNDNNNTKICFLMHVNETALGRSAYIGLRMRQPRLTYI